MAPLPRTLLLTRPREQSLAFATALERVLPGRFQALVAPMLAIAPTGAPIALDGIQAKTPLYRFAYNVLRVMFPLWRALFPTHVLTTRELGRAMIDSDQVALGGPVRS